MIYDKDFREFFFSTFFFSSPDGRLDTLKLEQKETNCKYHFLLKEVKEKFCFGGLTHIEQGIYTLMTGRVVREDNWGKKAYS